MSEKNTKKWNDEVVAKLSSLTGSESPVSAATVAKVAETLGFTARSVAAKLRQLGVEVASMAEVKAPAFSEDETNALSAFVQKNSGKLTYKEIAEQFPGEFSAKQIQGKLLALELTSHVKPAEKVEAVRTYTTSEEEQFVKLAKQGKFIEDIAAVLGKSIASVRGKALSLTRSGELAEIPKQKQSYAAPSTDPVEVLGDKLATMTVAQIATETSKTERGIKTLLTRRGIKVADYDGAAKKAKAEAKASA